MNKSPFLLSISQDMRQKGYSLRTEKTYLHWIKRFILFHGKRHPNSMGGEEVRQFLSHLANSEHVATNTQKIALNALAFLYNKFLNMPLGDLDFVPASKPRYLPTVLSVAEVQKILQCVESLRNKVIFSLLYGSGLRISECLRLRIKDIDFNLGCIQVQDGKGNKHRTTLLPTCYRLGAIYAQPVGHVLNNRYLKLICNRTFRGRAYGFSVFGEYATRYVGFWCFPCA